MPHAGRTMGHGTLGLLAVAVVKERATRGAHNEQLSGSAVPFSGQLKQNTNGALSRWSDSA